MIKSFRIALILSILAVAGQPSNAQKSDKEEEYRKMITLIEGSAYRFLVRSVNPTGGRTIHPSSEYTMLAEEGAFKADLPYFGRAYQAAYGSTEGGIVFDGEAEDLEIIKNDRKRTVRVFFKIIGKDDSFQVSLVAGIKGYGSLNISCQNRQPISYYGTVTPLE